MTRDTAERARRRALEYLEKAGIAVTAAEAAGLEVSDLGLGNIDAAGLQVLTYVNNNRYCAKEIVLFPNQMCTEHRHPPSDSGRPGKQETFRCRWGEVALYVEGPPTAGSRARVPEDLREHLHVWHEIVLRPGDQFTLPQNTLHWFQAGPDGAVVSEFSSASDDVSDIFTDPRVRRLPEVD